MKNNILFLLLVLFLSSCSIQNPTRTYRVTVLDFETNLPIDSAKIDLTAMVDAIDVYNQHGFTNEKGVFKFKTHYPEKAEITFGAAKVDYQKIGVDHPDGRNLGYYYLENNKEKEITLYLTKNTFDEIFDRPIYGVDLIVEQLLANNCSFNLFDLEPLGWEDIPKLLKIANNTEIIQKYPVHPLSSTVYVDCYVGIVALWFVEYIRVSEQDAKTTGIRRFPYQLPQLMYFGEINSVTNTKEQMLIAYSNYKNWWNKVENLPSKESSTIDPLKDSNLRWKASLNLPN
jgi:hypothetical protein